MVNGLSCFEQAIWLQKVKRASNLEVALTLFLDERTVKEHLRRISRKLRTLAAVVDGDLGGHDHGGTLPFPSASTIRVDLSSFRGGRGRPIG